MRRVTRIFCCALLCSLAVLGSTVGPTWAVSASPALVDSSTTVRVDGTIVVFAGEEDMHENHPALLPVADDVRLLTSTGETVSITGALTDGAETGSSFTGTLSLSLASVDKVEEELSDAGAIPAMGSAGQKGVIEGESELGRAILAASDAADVPMEADTAQITEAGASRLTAAISHTFDVAVVTLPSDPTEVVISDAAVGTTTEEMSSYWASQSAGQIASISRPDAVQRFVSADACSPQTVWSQAASIFGHSSDYYWRSSAAEHLVVIAPESCTNAYVGLGSLGSVNKGGQIWASFQSAITTHTIAHEFGHNQGLKHSGSMTCTGTSAEGETCTTQEYGDYYDIMGASYSYYDEEIGIRGNRNLPALNVTHKSVLGALNSDELRTLTLPAGNLLSETEITMLPASANSGLRGIVATDPLSSERYFLEYRSGTGIDEGAIYASNVSPALAPGVRILKLDWNKRSSVLTHPISNNEYTRAQFLNPGQSFRSPTGGLAVSVGSIGENAAFTVYLGEAPRSLTTSTPTVTNESGLAVGNIVTVGGEGWGPHPVTMGYQWMRDGTKLDGATAASYQLSPDDLNARMSVTVVGSKTGYLSESVTSAQTGWPVGLGNISNAQPTISGTPEEGSLLTAIPGAWTPEPVNFTYQWHREGVDLPNATGATYLLTSTDVGSRIGVWVSGTKTGYQDSFGRSSTWTTTIEPAPATLTTTVPRISGLMVRGQTLTINAGTWGPGSVTLTYEWFRAGLAIVNANKSSYTLTAADQGKPLTVAVTGAKSGYLAERLTSAATSTVKAKPTPKAPTSVSAIAGNAQATVSWTASPTTDGSAVATYTVTSTPDGISSTGTSTSSVLTGLSNGVAYTFTVVAENDVGKSTASVSSTPVRPRLPKELTVTRLAGADRFAASAAISANSFSPGTPVVYVTNGYKFPDALSAAPVAGNANAPILLVTPGAIPESISAELTRLKPEKIVVLGGTDSVHQSLEKDLRTYATTGTVSRLAGPDRFSASAAISAGSFSAGVPVVYITNGFNFPDALSAAPVAGNSNAPILLVEPTRIPQSIAEELDRLKPARIIVLGGTDSVTKPVADALEIYTPAPVERFAGSDRFAASAAISAGSFEVGVPVVYVANGYNFPDALSAAPVAGHANAPILLVTPGSIPASIAQELTRLQPARIVVLGGINSVSSTVGTALQGFTR